MTEKRYTYAELKNGQWSVDYTTFEEIYGEENRFHHRICVVNNKEQAQKIVNLLNKKEERIQELEDSINNLLDNEPYWEKKALKRIKELELFINKIADHKGEIVLLNGYGYNIREVIK